MINRKWKFEKIETEIVKEKEKEKSRKEIIKTDTEDGRG